MNPIYHCQRCSIPYDWRRSPSSLRMSYCGSLCERAALGFTIDSLISTRRDPLYVVRHEYSASLIQATLGGRMIAQHSI